MVEEDPSPLFSGVNYCGFCLCGHIFWLPLYKLLEWKLIFKVKMLIQTQSKNHKAQNMQFSYYKGSENRQDKKKLK